MMTLTDDGIDELLRGHGVPAGQWLAACPAPAIRSRKYAVVRPSPVVRSTVGCQPRTVVAIVMSGHRCNGSSCGKGRWTMRDFDPVRPMTLWASSLTGI